MQGILLCIAALAYAAVIPLHGAAQASGTNESASDTASDYAALIREALSEFEARNYAEARALFERAHALKPNARTQRGLGITAFELKRYVQSQRELEAALADTRTPLTEAQRRDVKALLEKARRFIGRVRLDIVPHDATVLVDGTASASSDLLLDLGEHQVSVHAPGYRDAALKLVIDGGEDVKQRVELTRIDVSPEQVAASEVGHRPATAAQAGTDPTSPRDEGGSVFGTWWFWTVAGVVVAGAVAGTLIAVNAGDTTIHTEPVTTPNTPRGAHLEAAMVR